MKRLTTVLLLLFLVACGSENNNNNQVETIEELEEIEETITIDVWDVDPIYDFDNIDNDFADRFWVYVSFPFEVNNDNLYYIYDPGGLIVIKDNLIGFMNKEGVIVTQPNFVDMFKYNKTINLKLKETELSSAFLKNDYSTRIEQNTGFAAIGGTGAPRYYWNKNGYAAIAELSEQDYKYHETRKINPHIECFNKGYLKNDSDIVVFSSIITDGVDLDNKDSILIIYSKDKDVVLDYPDYDINQISQNIVSLVKRKQSNKRHSFYNPITYENDIKSILYVDSNGELIASGFECGYGFYENMAAVKINGKWGYIDTNGNVIVDFIFDKATSLYGGKAWVTYKGKTGRLNIKDMIDNQVPFNEEVLSVEKYALCGEWKTVVADSIRIRKDASTNSEKVGVVYNGTKLYVLESKENGNYTWYKLADNMWVADKENKWIK